MRERRVAEMGGQNLRLSIYIENGMFALRDSTQIYTRAAWLICVSADAAAAGNAYRPVACCTDDRMYYRDMEHWTERRIPWKDKMRIRNKCPGCINLFPGRNYKRRATCAKAGRNTRAICFRLLATTIISVYKSIVKLLKCIYINSDTERFSNKSTLEKRVISSGKGLA